MAAILENQLYEDANGKFRVLAVGRDTVVYFAFAGGKEKPGLSRMPYEDFEHRVEDKGCKLAEDPYDALRLMNRPQDSKAYQRAASNYELIEDIVSDKDYLFDKGLRAQLIQKKYHGARCFPTTT